jgi:hypothetical protein
VVEQNARCNKVNFANVAVATFPHSEEYKPKEAVSTLLLKESHAKQWRVNYVQNV